MNPLAVATREKIKASIEEQGALTDELSAAIDAAATLTELDDLYRPYKKKRKTRASVAKEKGLSPLAEMIYAQSPDCKAPTEMAENFINAELGVETAEDALSGAMDIIAELISDDADIRKRMRFVASAHGILTVKAGAEDIGVYEMYADYSESVAVQIANCQKLAAQRNLEIIDYADEVIDLENEIHYVTVCPKCRQMRKHLDVGREESDIIYYADITLDKRYY